MTTTVCLTFDNLGEAAERQLGMGEPGAPMGGHRSVTTSLPIVLEELDAARLPATFFVEGVNAEAYPDALRSIADAGHELGYHAWCHEEWASLEAAEEGDNLDRGLSALRALDLEVDGFRPPGGLLSPRTLELARDRGLAYISPAGWDPGVQDGVVLLPFAWPAVDAFHVLPPFAALREHATGSEEAGGPDGVRDALTAAVDAGGTVVLVLHTWLVEAERDAVRAVLRHVREAVEDGRARAVRCVEAAALVVQDDLAGSPRLDTTSWTSPG